MSAMRVPFPVRRTCTLSGRATRYVASRPYQARDESTTDGVARPAMTMGIVLLIACLAAETTGSPMATMTIDMQPDQLSEEFGNAQTVARGLPPVPACGCRCWRSGARSRSARQWRR